MGGIACYFQFDSSQNKAVLDDKNLHKSIEYIKHRGPDATGTYFSACGRTGKRSSCIAQNDQTTHVLKHRPWLCSTFRGGHEQWPAASF